MSDYEMMQNSSPLLSQRSNLMNNNDGPGTVPPPPAYPGHIISGPGPGGSTVGASGGGLLRTKISLGGRKPTVVMPFLLMKPELPVPSPINGGMNLLTYYNLDHSWNKFCAPNKKLKEELSAFLPHLPGNIDMPGNQDNSSLRSLIDKPPICGKEILPLSTSALAGFKLQAGSIPENYRVFAGATAPLRLAPGPTTTTTRRASEEKSEKHSSKKKHKRKHERSSHAQEDRPTDTLFRDDKHHHAASTSAHSGAFGSNVDGGSSNVGPTSSGAVDEGRKSKTDDGGGGGGEKKKKKKKDKKRKRSRSPDHGSSNTGGGASVQQSNPSFSSDFVDF